MFCIKCGSKMPENVAFCSQCGTKMYQSQVQPRQQEQASVQPQVPVQQQVPVQPQPQATTIQTNEKNVPKITSYDTNQLLNQFGLSESYNYASYFFTQDISRQYNNDNMNDENISCCIYFYDTGFNISSTISFSVLVSAGLAPRSGGIEFYYSDIIRIDPPQGNINVISFYTKDGKQHRINCTKKGDMYNFLLQKISTAQQVPFVPSEYIANKSKVGEPMHDYYKSIFLISSIGLILLVFLGKIMFNSYDGETDVTLFQVKLFMTFIAGIPIFITTSLEESQLRSRGLSKGKISFFDKLITPLYLYKRAGILNQSLSQLITWCVLFVVAWLV